MALCAQLASGGNPAAHYARVRRELSSLLTGCVLANASCVFDAQHRKDTATPPGTASCPEAPVAAYGDVAARGVVCSRADVIGSGMTRLGGKVLEEAQVGSPGDEVSGAQVSIHALQPGFRVGDPGKSLASTTTDAQGHYEIAGMFDPGEYMVIVRDPATSRVVAYRRVRLGYSDNRKLEDVTLWIPRDRTDVPP